MSEDRTSEFFDIANTLAQSSPFHHEFERLSTRNNHLRTFGRQDTLRTNNTNATSNPTKNAAYEELRNFHSTASDISLEIAVTSKMLSELSRLVRRRGLFMDDTDQVNDLVLRIKTKVESLNRQLDEVGQVIGQQKRRLGRNSQAGQEATNLVGQLKEEFVTTTSTFKDVLQQRSDRMKEQNDRKKDVFSQSIAPGGMKSEEIGSMLSLGSKPPVYGLTNPMGAQVPLLDLTSGLRRDLSKGESNSCQLPRPNGVLSNSASLPYSADNHGLRLRHASSGEGFSSSPHVLTPIEMQRLEQESGSQTLQLIPDQNYLRERADAMTTVEANIVELGTIFNKLAVMVNEHREMVHRVEDNVEEANNNINLSMAALTDTITSLRTNRQLFTKILSVCVVFIILFVTFFA